MKVKKIVMWVSVVCFGLAAALALAIYFTNIRLKGNTGKLMITLLTVGIASSMSINGLNLYERKKNILSIISIALIGLSGLLALYMCWFSFHFNNFTKFVIVVSITSILFNFVVTCILNLKKEKFIFQIFVYINLVFFDSYIAWLLFNFKDAKKLMAVFVVNIILSLFGSIILVVFSRKNYGYIEPEKNDSEYIKITRKEYDEMKARIAELEEKLNKNEE